MSMKKNWSPLLPLAALALPLVLAWNVVALTPAPAAAADAAAVPDGMKVFQDMKCSLCHSVESKAIERTSKSDKMKGPDLSDVGSTRTIEWLVGFVKREETLNGEEHKKEWKGTDEELGKLATWLVTLEKS
jgi:mono/diheme cytochrome c family protein